MSPLRHGAAVVHKGGPRRVPGSPGSGYGGAASMASVSGGTAMARRRTVAGLLAVPALLLPALLAGCGDDSSVADPPIQSAPHSIATSDPPAHESAQHFIRRWAEVGEADGEHGQDGAATLALSSRVQGLPTAWCHDVKRFYATGASFTGTGGTSVSIETIPEPAPACRGVHGQDSTQVQPRTRSLSTSSVQRLAGGVTTRCCDDLKHRRRDLVLVTAQARLAQ